MPGPVGLMTVGLAVTLLASLLGIHRSRQSGRLDPFHPLVFPTIYVGVATLAPAMWLWLSDTSLGYIHREALSTRTPLLLTLAVVGFIAGAAVPFKARPGQSDNTGSGLVAIGRIALVIPLALAIRDLRNGLILTRGAGQDVYTASDTLTTAGYILAPAAVGLILIGTLAAKRSVKLLDWVAIGALVVALGLNGRRAGAIAVAICVLVYLTRRRAAAVRAVAGLSALAAFAWAVVTYRTQATGGETGLAAIPVLLRDLGSIAYTTGITAQLPYQLDGSTIIAGIARQIPGPLSVNLLGPVDGTGVIQFRNLSGFGSANNGFGFSIPAEGVLNFGSLGAFILPMVVGVAFAWMYSRFNLAGFHAHQWVYLIAVATLPFSWRSDVLGLVKGVLYPAILFWLAITIIASTRPRTSPDAARRDAG